MSTSVVKKQKSSARKRLNPYMGGLFAIFVVAVGVIVWNKIR